MALSNLPRKQLTEISAQLDQALYNHKEWHRLLIRTLICRLPGDKHDLAPEAFKECRFGQWYYNYADKELKSNSGFKAIGEEHKRLHALTTQLLKLSFTGDPIPTYDYDNFTNSLERLQLEIFALKREIEDLVYHRDALTGAVSRVDMLPILREQLALMKHQVYKSCYLVMIDFDNFSKVNDTYGHGAGDKVLETATSYIIKKLRSYDKIFRYGGEEFLLSLPNTDIDTAREIVERIREGIASLDIDAGEEKTIHITASFGLARLSPTLPVEKSIERADKAVYAAKSAGRNCVKVWSELTK